MMMEEEEMAKMVIPMMAMMADQSGSQIQNRLKMHFMANGSAN